MEQQVLALQKLLATTDGRDKVYRLVQFAAKLTRGPYTTQLAEEAEKVPLLVRKAFTLELILADSRKLFRLARGLNILVKYWGNRRSAPNKAALVTDASLFWFFAFDHVVWLYRSGLWTSPLAGKRALFWTRCAGHCLFLASFVSLLLHGYKAWSVLKTKLRLRGQGKKAQGASHLSDDAPKAEHTAEEATQMQKMPFEGRAALSRVFRYGCDVVVGLNMARPGEYSQTLVGAAGVLSSVIQIVQIWPSGSEGPHGSASAVAAVTPTATDHQVRDVVTSRRLRRRTGTKSIHQS
ncbi:peroxisomal bioproteinsis factor 11 alpha [Cyanidiococcus yangmingshanensis]|uniref:Peroxisomal bioproteinsis factor 11 alpha n=1 Tax=Cyanidiococcus yangmingshanensis TaxID=2690220 RepID=A0A7J7IIU0_9RHOD|nr:peroxisomal bioproteinsis factor 11 alpha [Cyanidiococcus yangmingshanensis]